ncbi:MAG: MFS transporter [Planctomycetaceae bacterium]|jgi:MFS family permease|nr:MFS transporter [Planctomycetaceae bacterium]
MTNSKNEEHWYSGITRYQWIVLLIALVGWLFDTFEGQIFVASMREAMPSLVDAQSAENIPLYNNIALGAFLIGGALGGIVFGIISDKIGRKRTMIFSILFYSFFTWMSAFSQTWWHLAGLRFFVALGVGGEWAIASAFVAEVFPDKARAHAGSIFHASGIFGTLLAVAVGAFLIGNPAVSDWCHSPALSWLHRFVDPASLPWRFGFALGLFPAILIVFVRFYVQEPESWKIANERAKLDPVQKTGDFRELFHGSIFRSTLVGTLLAAIGMATFWGVHIYGKDALFHAAEHDFVSKIINQEPSKYNTETETGKEEIKIYLKNQSGLLKRWEMFGMLLVTAGLGFGQLYFGPLSQKIGRRKTFVFYHLGSFIIALVVFQLVHGIIPLLILLPIFGFLTAGMHAGYAVYFPELYPTRLRSTGTGFCFNAGRLIAVPVLFFTGWIQTNGITLITAATLLSFLYLLGPVTIYFAEETKGQELLN